MPKYVITGGPGAGKTSLLEVLRQRNYRCSEEVSRKLIMEESEKGSDCLPWKDLGWFAERAFGEMLACWHAAAEDKICFFDRGIPDIVAYLVIAGLPMSEPMEKALSAYPYATKVFILPPWEQIYTCDPARWQTFEEAQTIYDRLHTTYRLLGYELVELPLCPVEQRADLVLKSIDL